MKKLAILMTCIIVLLVLYNVISKKAYTQIDPKTEYLKKVLSNLNRSPLWLMAEVLR